MRHFFAKLGDKLQRYSHKKVSFIFTILALTLALFLFADQAQAGENLPVSANVLALGMSWLASFFIGALGNLLTFVIDAVVYVASYNDFIGSGAVTTGWVITRDLANMFVVIMLLIIAFATVLKLEAYNYQKLLPRLLMMAILVNFSKTITGIFIDFSQVMMITFVNGFRAVAAGNFIQAMNIDRILTIAQQAQRTTQIDPITGWDIAIMSIIALVVMAIALVTITIMLAVLVFRIVMLWLLVVVSPLIFLLSAIPRGQKYHQQWWDQFINYLIVGPALAFFIWLALSVAGDGNIASVPNFPAKDLADPGRNFSGEQMINMIVTIGLLMGGLMVTSTLGVAGGGLARSAVGKIQSTGARAALAPLRAARGAARGTVGYGAEVLSARTGIELRPSEWKKGFQSMRQEGRATRAADQARIMAKRAEKGGVWNTLRATMGAPQELSKGLKALAPATLVGKERKQKWADEFATRTKASRESKAKKLALVSPIAAEKQKLRNQETDQRLTARQQRQMNRMNDPKREGEGLIKQRENLQNEVAEARQVVDQTEVDTRAAERGISEQEAEKEVWEEKQRESVSNEVREQQINDNYQSKIENLTSKGRIATDNVKDAYRRQATQEVDNNIQANVEARIDENMEKYTSDDNYKAKIDARLRSEGKDNTDENVKETLEKETRQDVLLQQATEDMKQKASYDNQITAKEEQIVNINSNVNVQAAEKLARLNARAANTRQLQDLPASELLKRGQKTQKAELEKLRKRIETAVDEGIAESTEELKRVHKASGDHWDDIIEELNIADDKKQQIKDSVTKED